MGWAIRTRGGTCRRQNLRVEVVPPLKVVLRTDLGEFPGELQDISLGGARIKSTSVPQGIDRFDLTHGDSEEIRADVKWSEGSIMGVSFERGAPAVGLLTDCLRRLVPLDRARA